MTTIILINKNLKDIKFFHLNIFFCKLRVQCKCLNKYYPEYFTIGFGDDPCEPLLFLPNKLGLPLKKGI